MASVIRSTEALVPTVNACSYKRAVDDSHVSVAVPIARI